MLGPSIGGTRHLLSRHFSKCREARDERESESESESGHDTEIPPCLSFLINTDTTLFLVHTQSGWRHLLRHSRVRVLVGLTNGGGAGVFFFRIIPVSLSITNKPSTRTPSEPNRTAV